MLRFLNQQLKNMEQNFTHEQSLTLINEMINRARNNVITKGYSLIYWGYVTAVLAIANFILWQMFDNTSNSFHVWLVMIPAMVAGYFIERRSQREKLVKTQIDHIVGMIWAGFFISFVVFTVVIHVIAYRTECLNIFALNIPVILTMFGMGHFVNACAFRFKMWYAFAAVSWAGAIACCAFLQVEMHLIIFAVCMIAGLAVPGHILNYQAKKSHV